MPELSGPDRGPKAISAAALVSGSTSSLDSPLRTLYIDSRASGMIGTAHAQRTSRGAGRRLRGAPMTAEQTSPLPFRSQLVSAREVDGRWSQAGRTGA